MNMMMECFPQKLSGILGNMTGKRIAVIGDIILDRYIRGSVERISPEAPIPIVQAQETFVRLGGAANVMQNVIALGGAAFAFGIVGDDDAGHEVISQLCRNKIECSGVVTAVTRETTVKTRILSGSQQLLRIDKENTSPINDDQKELLIVRLTRLLADNQIDAVVLEDYAKGVLDQEISQAIVDAANHYGVFSLLDPNPRNHMRVEKLTVLKPNCRELWALGGVLPSNNRADLVRVASTIMQDWEIENLVLTLAQDGILLFSRTGDPAGSALPAVAREVYDVSGAGDTVIAVIAMALAAHAEIREAVLLGNLAAGIVVGKLGTSTVSSLEIQQELAKNNLS